MIMIRRLTGSSVCLALLVAPAFGWRIPSYYVRMEIQPDSSLIVTETIRADFTGDPHHGIFRDMPIVEKDRFGNNFSFREEILSVTDEAGRRLQARLRRRSGRIRIYIGDPNVLVSDLRTYVIRYRLLRAIHFFDEHDELYWNAVGREWEVPIESAACVVTLPSNVPIGQLRTASYTGVYGSTTSDAQSDTPDNHTARFWMTRSLEPGEGMTIVVGWPKGIVSRPPFKQEARWFVTDNGYFFLPPVFLAALCLLWVRIGRDPETGRSEMVSYDPPDRLRPAELGTLIDERVDVRDIAASIVDLAVRGYIHIKADVQKGFLSTKRDYLLELQRPYTEVMDDLDLADYEKELIRALFSAGESRWVSTLSNHFYVYLPRLRDELYESMVKRGYFTHRPDSVRTSYQIAGGMLTALGVVTLAILLGGVLVGMPVGWGAALAVCGVFLIAAARAMPRKTKKGKNALLGARGFEEYLSRAERQEIEFQERHNYFERFLPYAIAFGIADKWAKAFEGIQTAPPQWYSGYEGGFQPTIFAHDLSVASSNWGVAMSSTPRSGGSGSGFSGGSSGGGGGGGGGGGW